MPAPDFLIDARLAVLQLAAEHRLASKTTAHLDRLAADLDRYIQDYPDRDGIRAALIDHYYKKPRRRR